MAAKKVETIVGEFKIEILNDYLQNAAQGHGILKPDIKDYIEKV